jgi:serine/threonine-protein kinase
MPSPLESLSAALAGRYNVERELGAGGMATVYLARDVKHDRHVALKLLRPELAAVIGAARFLNEIKTTANLQHPHILALHDSGEVEGTVFYVMPYVDGESLRDRLNRERQLPIDEAIRITVEVAGALEYAHQHKVIHRDIKPENILLQGGHALVADFGIALAASRTDGGTRMTETGMSLGTPHYMSPEQAMGEREITSKTDIYALGCVLYEMLAGEPPFTGPTAQAIVGRVMTEDARSLTTQRRTIPRHVDAAVHRALAKLPADRFASAAAFAEALVNPAAMAMPEASIASAPARARRGVAPLVVGGIVAFAAIGAFIAGRRTKPPEPRTLVQLEIQPPESVTGMSACCGIAVALSPNGNTLVFVGVRQNGRGLYRRTIGRPGSELIPGTEGGAMPFFSPDGQWLAFFADGKLKKISMAGGPPLPIVAVERIAEATWGEGDVIVYAAAPVGGSRGVLYSVPAAGGAARALADADTVTSRYAPSFLPGGRAVLFSGRSGPALTSVHIGVIELASKKVDTVATGTRAMYANGYLVYAGSDNTLLAQPFDASKRKTTGPAVAILDRVALHGGVTHEFTLSTNGMLAYQTSGGSNPGGETFRLIGESGSTAIALPGRTNDNLEDPAFSPDGKRIVFRIVGNDAAAQDLWMLSRSQGIVERFTVGGGGAPAWTHDGRRIAYAVVDDGLYIKNADGTGSAQRILKGDGVYPGSWLPDNKSLLFTAAGRAGSKADIGLLAVGDTAPRWIVSTEFNERNPQLSPDGRWLAYESDRTGQFEIYVQPLTGDGARIQVSATGGVSPRWSPDSRSLYYVNASAIQMAQRAPGLAFDVASRKQVAEVTGIDLNANNVNWDVQPDGKGLLYIDQGGGLGMHIVWILDWPQLVKAMATGRKN